MKKMRRRYDREFNISVVAELEGGKPLAQIAHEQGIHPSLPSQWRDELADNPEKAFSCNGKKMQGSDTDRRTGEIAWPAQCGERTSLTSIRHDGREGSRVANKSALHLLSSWRIASSEQISLLSSGICGIIS
jgi:hypothetical protein